MNSRVDASRLHERGHRAVAAGPAPQRRHEVRVRQAAHVEHQVGVDRHAVLEAEAEQRDDQAARATGRATAPMKNCRSSWTVMSDVSTISSAMLADRRQPRPLVADALRSTERSGASGCGRRVSLKRRTSVALLASRKISTGLRPRHLPQPLEDLRETTTGSCLRARRRRSRPSRCRRRAATASPASGSASSAGCRRRSSRDPRARGSPATCPSRTGR